MIHCKLVNFDFVEKNALITYNDSHYTYYQYKHFYNRIFMHNIVIVIYRDCAEFIFIKYHNCGKTVKLYHCIMPQIVYYDNKFIYEDYAIATDNAIIYDRKEYSYFELQISNNVFSINNDIVFNEIIRKLFKRFGSTDSANKMSGTKRIFLEYIKKFINTPSESISINCPNSMLDFYNDLFADNMEYFKYAIVSNEYISILQNKLYNDIPWLKFISKFSINIERRNTIDNETKYWNIIDASIMLTHNTTKNDVLSFYKELLKYLKYYLLKNNIINEDLLPFLKISNMVLTKDKRLVITIMYKNDILEVHDNAKK